MPKISQTYAVRASDGMIVTCWDVKGIRARLRNYEDAPKPLGWSTAEFARMNGVFDGEGFTITGISVLSRADERACANPEKKRNCYCISGRRQIAVLLRDRRHGQVLEHDVERVRPFTRKFWWADDDRFVAVGRSGRPNPDDYAKWKADQAMRKAEADRKAELAERTADDDFEDLAISDAFL